MYLCPTYSVFSQLSSLQGGETFLPFIQNLVLSDATEIIFRNASLAQVIKKKTKKKKQKPHIVPYFLFQIAGDRQSTLCLNAPFPTGGQFLHNAPLKSHLFTQLHTDG